MSTACVNALPQQLQNCSAGKCDYGSQRPRNSVDSNTLNGVEENGDLILSNSQALSSPTISQLWYSPPPQYSSFLPYLSYYPDTATVQQNHQDKKKQNFCCGGIAKLLWTIATIIALGLLATLILALFVI